MQQHSSSPLAVYVPGANADTQNDGPDTHRGRLTLLVLRTVRRDVRSARLAINVRREDHAMRQVRLLRHTQGPSARRLRMPPGQMAQRSMSPTDRIARLRTHSSSRSDEESSFISHHWLNPHAQPEVQSTAHSAIDHKISPHARCYSLAGAFVRTPLAFTCRIIFRMQFCIAESNAKVRACVSTSCSSLLSAVPSIGPIHSSPFGPLMYA